MWRRKSKMLHGICDLLRGECEMPHEICDFAVEMRNAAQNLGFPSRKSETPPGIQDLHTENSKSGAEFPIFLMESANAEGIL